MRLVCFVGFVLFCVLPALGQDVCDMGYYMDDGQCEICPAGYFCPDGKGKISCNGWAETGDFWLWEYGGVGLVDFDECKMKLEPGEYATCGDYCTVSRICGSGYYCPGGVYGWDDSVLDGFVSSIGRFPCPAGMVGNGTENGTSVEEACGSCPKMPKDLDCSTSYGEGFCFDSNDEFGNALLTLLGAPGCANIRVFAPSYELLGIALGDVASLIEVSPNYVPEKNHGLYLLISMHAPDFGGYAVLGILQGCAGGYFIQDMESLLVGDLPAVVGFDVPDVLGQLCVPVGPNYWSPGVSSLDDTSAADSVFRFACPGGTRSAGYGVGADEESDCCVDGYRAYNGVCVKMCDAGISYLKTSTGMSVPLFADKHTERSINIKYNNKVCYVPLGVGKKSGTINVGFNGVVYHVTE